MRDLSDAVHFSWFLQMTCKPILNLSILPCLDVLFRKQKLGRSALFLFVLLHFHAFLSSFAVVRVGVRQGLKHLTRAFLGAKEPTS